MGKTRFAKHTRRFADVVREPAVYVAELSGGVLKVGATGNARYRLMSLQSDVKRTHGLGLHRFHIVPTATAKAAYELEATMVSCLEHYADVLPGHREFFTGITFDQTCELFGLPLQITVTDVEDDRPCTWGQPKTAPLYVVKDGGLFGSAAQVFDFYPAHP